ncbi:MAG: glycosyltransferase [Chthoniobacterales bacterium]
MRKHAVVLAARCDSSKDAEAIPDEAERFRHEPGFVAVGKGSEAFLDWWMASLRRDFDAARSINRALLDQLPPSIPVHVLREAAWNLGYWNLAGRELTAVDDHVEIDGDLLRAFNFSGYELDKPHLLSKHQGHHPRVLLSETPVVEKLCRDYYEKVSAAVAEEKDRKGFGLLPSGLKIDRHMRRLYSLARSDHQNGKDPEPPDPYTTNGEPAFLDWLNQPLGKGRPQITRYMLAIHAARSDLQVAFPDPLGAQAAQFHEWFLGHGHREENPSPLLLPPDARSSSCKTIGQQENGANPSVAVNVAGYLRAELGMGEAARLLIAALDAAGVPYTTTSYEQTTNRQSHPFQKRAAPKAAVDINIVCVNADQLPAFAERMGPAFFAGRHNIAVWFWEVDEFPAALHHAFTYVDEIWVASRFVRDTLLKATSTPVWRFHLPIQKPEIDHTLTRSHFDLPESFCFLFVFDLLSVLERKNPLGLIAAFRRAFAPGEGPVLVLKTINGDQRIREMEKLKFAARGHSDIKLIDGYLSPIEKNTLTAHCDCYVSLHRSEGFGLTIAEAMALGKPAIATAYSGNLEFMTPENSYLCGYSERAVGHDCEPYPANSYWAEPDIAEAASLMRHAYTHPEEARARGIRAADDVRNLHPPSVAGAAIARRIQAIREQRASAEDFGSIEMLADRIEALQASHRKMLKRRGSPQGAVDREQY